MNISYYNLEFLSKTGPKISKKLSLASEVAEGTSSSNSGSTLSYDLLLAGIPNVSMAMKRQLNCLLEICLFYFNFCDFWKRIRKN